MTETRPAETNGVLPGTMRAWTQHRYGGPDVVAADTVPLPDVGDDDVLLRVRATALNSGDVRVMRGDPRLVRLFFGLRRPRIAVRGMDVAGTVVRVGKSVESVAIGDEVVGEIAGGGLAEFAAARADRVVPRPDAVPPTSAAALPLAGGTAVQALDLGGVGAGARVLIIGASGGVGTYAVQLAALRGADVWALTGARTRELIEQLGATRTFDYRQTPLTALPEASFDAVICIESAAPLRALRSLVREGGALVMVSGSGGPILGPIGRILRGALLSVGSRRKIRSLAATAKPAITRELLTLVASGRIRPVIERTWSLSGAGDALAHVDAGHTVGKVVVLAE